MAKHLLHFVKGAPAVDQERRELVAQVMNPQMWQAGLPTDAAQYLVDGGVGRRGAIAPSNALGMNAITWPAAERITPEPTTIATTVKLLNIRQCLISFPVGNQKACVAETLSA